MLSGLLTFDKRDLLEQSNVYIRWNRILKLRDMNFKDGWYKRLDLKRINKERLNQDDIDYLKTFNKVIIEDDYGINFINFTGGLGKTK
ncbi:hypothetical protein [Aquibacillus saliphilus]|uniref:hypothetical protein n=1 Tax=Aquibacillus saliphilus TaxID=1909422 RepID=UPI001CF090A5|nr:hypothetical protein [Aquibacillus saliphilus]